MEKQRKLNIEGYINRYEQFLQEWLKSGYQDEADFIKIEIERSESFIKDCKDKIKYIITIPKRVKTLSNNGLTNIEFYQTFLAFEEEYLYWLKKKQVLPKDQRLTHPQIALICIYNDLHITKENAAEIALKYGWTSNTSGQKTYQEFIKYYHPTDRTGLPKDPTPRKIKNKISLIESVLPYLETSGIKLAQAEIIGLQNLLTNSFL
jgi:hypothetical protein